MRSKKQYMYIFPLLLLMILGSILNQKLIFAKTLSINANISYAGTYGNIKLKYNENSLAKDSLKYDKKLSFFLSGISSLMYNSSDLSKKKILKKLAYKNISYKADKKKKSVSYVIARKITKIKGKKTNILLIAIRGSEDEQWQDNFNLGQGKKTHAGFNYAAKSLYKALEKYIKKYKLNRANTKILLTGHSRGGAVANLLGQKIIKNRFNKNKIKRRNIFVYTFASPNTTKDTNAKGKRYKRIFNIVNKYDSIANILPSKWGYKRYGRTIILSESIGKRIKKNYRKFTGTDYKLSVKSAKKIQSYFKYVVNNIKSNKEYYRKNLQNGEMEKNQRYSLKNLYSNLILYVYGNSSQKTKLAPILAEIGFGYWGDLGKRTLELFMEYGTMSTFIVAHRPETYSAKLS